MCVCVEPTYLYNNTVQIVYISVRAALHISRRGSRVAAGPMHTRRAPHIVRIHTYIRGGYTLCARYRIIAGVRGGWVLGAIGGRGGAVHIIAIMRPTRAAGAHRSARVVCQGRRRCRISAVHDDGGIYRVRYYIHIYSTPPLRSTAFFNSDTHTQNKCLCIPPNNNVYALDRRRHRAQTPPPPPPPRRTFYNVRGTSRRGI